MGQFLHRWGPLSLAVCAILIFYRVAQILWPEIMVAPDRRILGLTYLAIGVIAAFWALITLIAIWRDW